MCLVVYIDDVLLFGPDEKEMDKGLSKLHLEGFDLKVEEDRNIKTYDFLGIHITKETDANDNKIIKLTQLGLIKKLLECVGHQRAYSSSKQIWGVENQDDQVFSETWVRVWLVVSE